MPDQKQTVTHKLTEREPGSIVCACGDTFASTMHAQRHLRASDSEAATSLPGTSRKPTAWHAWTGEQRDAFHEAIRRWTGWPRGVADEVALVRAIESAGFTFAPAPEGVEALREALNEYRDMVKTAVQALDFYARADHYADDDRLYDDDGCLDGGRHAREEIELLREWRKEADDDLLIDAPAVASSGAEGEREALAGLRATVEAWSNEPVDAMQSAHDEALDDGAQIGYERVLREIDRLAAAPAPAVTDSEGADVMADAIADMADTPAASAEGEGERVTLYRCPEHGLTMREPRRGRCTGYVLDPETKDDRECGREVTEVVATVAPAPAVESKEETP
jgi:hypothetical protein